MYFFPLMLYSKMCTLKLLVIFLVKPFLTEKKNAENLRSGPCSCFFPPSQDGGDFCSSSSVRAMTSTEAFSPVWPCARACELIGRVEPSRFINGVLGYGLLK